MLDIDRRVRNKVSSSRLLFWYRPYVRATGYRLAGYRLQQRGPWVLGLSFPNAPRGHAKGPIKFTYLPPTLLLCKVSKLVCSAAPLALWHFATFGCNVIGVAELAIR